MQPVPESVGKQKFPHQHLGFCILPFDPAHIIASGCFVVDIGHHPKIIDLYQLSNGQGKMSYFFLCGLLRLCATLSLVSRHPPTGGFISVCDFIIMAISPEFNLSCPQIYESCNLFMEFCNENKVVCAHICFWNRSI